MHCTVIVNGAQSSRLHSRNKTCCCDVRREDVYPASRTRLRGWCRAVRACRHFHVAHSRSWVCLKATRCGVGYGAVERILVRPHGASCMYARYGMTLTSKINGTESVDGKPEQLIHRSLVRCRQLSLARLSVDSSRHRPGQRTAERRVRVPCRLVRRAPICHTTQKYVCIGMETRLWRASASLFDACSTITEWLFAGTATKTTSARARTSSIARLDTRKVPGRPRRCSFSITGRDGGGLYRCS